MRRSAVLLGVLLLAACGTPAPAATPTPSASAAGTPTPSAAATATPSSSPTPVASTPTPTPSGTVSTAATCTASIDPTHNLVLATLVGQPLPVLRDIANPAAAQTICTFNGHLAPRFVTASVVSWAEGGGSAGSPGSIQRLDLASNRQTTVASWSAGTFGSGNFDWSPDGASLTYIGGGGPGPTWHLLAGGTDRLLATLPQVPGRGVSQQNDDFFLGFSPDGSYVAMENTFTGNASGNQAPLQVRRVSDGSLVYSTSGMTMAVWASKPGSLFWRDSAGRLSKWDATSGLTGPLANVDWTRPKASPDGRWIAYMTYDSGSLPHVGLFSVQGNSLGPQPAGLRSAPVFLNNDLVWYQEEAAKACDLSGCSAPTGRTFLYDIAGNSEAASRLSAVFDAWPKVTNPPGLG